MSANLPLPERLTKFLRDRKRTRPPQKVWFFREQFFLEEECLRAFRKLGLTVREFPVGKEWRPQAVSQLLTGLLDFQPDFCFSINHIGFDKAGWLTQLLRESDLPAATWYVDLPDFIIRGHPQNVSDRVHLFVWDRHYLDDLKEMGFPRVTYLPLAADTRLFRPYPSPPYKKFGKIPAAFVGSTWTQRLQQQLVNFQGEPEKLQAIEAAARRFQTGPHYRAREDLAALYPPFQEMSLGRQLIMEAACLWQACQWDRLGKIIPLSRAGLRVYGDPAWREFLPDPSAYGGEINYHRELPAFYQCVAVNLNITSLQMKDGLNQRVFDVPATGSFLLTDHKEALRENFTPDEVATFHDLNDAQEKLDYYLRHPQKRHQLAERARQKILTQHTYLHRCQTILGYLS
ncbi:MAG: glycosyltransferase [Thermodesulfobacteriota bacterium]